ncbi:MAG: MBL fold metallo-hydrolase [Myxococcota bacterium]
MSELLSWKIGRVQVTRVVETELALPPEGLLPEATKDALEPHVSWLAPHFLHPDGQITLAIQALVVESQGRKILVDTCVGDREVPGFPSPDGSNAFLDQLAAAGFPRESIDVVLCTHLHFDHVGWNTMRQDGAWVPTFPNAKYLFARVEYEHWQAETEAGRGQEYAFCFDDAVRPVVDAGLAELVETNHAITPEVRFEATPGHTPGHVAVRIASDGAEGLITGDLTHHPVQWAEVDWKMPADSDSAEAAATRRRLIDEHADTGTLVIGTHYAAPTAGRLVRSGKTAIFEA